MLESVSYGKAEFYISQFNIYRSILLSFILLSLSDTVTSLCTTVNTMSS